MVWFTVNLPSNFRGPLWTPKLMLPASTFYSLPSLHENCKKFSWCRPHFRALNFLKTLPLKQSNKNDKKYWTRRVPFNTMNWLSYKMGLNMNFQQSMSYVSKVWQDENKNSWLALLTDYRQPYVNQFPIIDLLKIKK